jgi:hypothetical protein
MLITPILDGEMSMSGLLLSFTHLVDVLIGQCGYGGWRLGDTGSGGITLASFTASRILLQVGKKLHSLLPTCCTV